MTSATIGERLEQLSNTRVRYLRDLDRIPQLSLAERESLREVSDRFAFRANTYYLGLIDWDDPADPIRRIVIPSASELATDGVLDPSDEESVTVVHGAEHKYTTTVLLLVSQTCGTFCRFCFRKRLFMRDNQEVSQDISAGLEYIRSHPEVDNVLLTGGDPLILSTGRLDRILTQLREIEHVRIIRIGSKLPAFNPYRVLDDDRLIEVISRHSQPDRRIYVMAHFNHPNELTEVAIAGLSRLLEAGAIVVNQTPLLQGVNDDPAVISDLFNRLSYVGVPPYYLFQGRPIAGNLSFKVSLRRAHELFEQAKISMSGLAKRARLIMSHSSGKIEILGFLDGRIILRYHQAKDPTRLGRLFAVPYRDEACWLDDPTAGASCRSDGLTPITSN
jgi:lysine 2,3-aminomutase